MTRVEAISAEIAEFACEETDPNGWTDVDWLSYLRSGECDETPLPEGMPSDVLDYGHAGMTLGSFVAHPTAVAAGLDTAHVLALRIATSSAFRRITGPLFVGCSDEKPHPYPATVAILAEAIRALQTAGASQAKAYLQANPIKASWEDATKELLTQYNETIEANLPNRRALSKFTVALDHTLRAIFVAFVCWCCMKWYTTRALKMSVKAGRWGVAALDDLLDFLDF